MADEAKTQQKNPLYDVIGGLMGIPGAILGPIAENLPYAIRKDGKISITGLLDFGGVTSMRKKEAAAAAKLNELKAKRKEQEIALGVYEMEDAERLDQGRGGLMDALAGLGIDPRITGALPQTQLAGLGKEGGGSALDRAEQTQRQEDRLTSQSQRHGFRMTEIGAQGTESRKTVAAGRGGAAASLKETPEEKRRRDRKERIFTKTLDAEMKRETLHPITGEPQTVSVPEAVAIAKRVARQAVAKGRGGKGVAPGDFPKIKELGDRAEAIVRSGVDPELAGIAAIAQVKGPTEALFLPRAKAGREGREELARAVVKRAKQLDLLIRNNLVEGDPREILAQVLREAGVPLNELGEISDQELVDLITKASAE